MSLIEESQQRGVEGLLLSLYYNAQRRQRKHDRVLE